MTTDFRTATFMVLESDGVDETPTFFKTFDEAKAHAVDRIEQLVGAGWHWDSDTESTEYYRADLSECPHDLLADIKIWKPVGDQLKCGLCGRIFRTFDELRQVLRSVSYGLGLTLEVMEGYEIDYR